MEIPAIINKTYVFLDASIHPQRHYGIGVYLQLKERDIFDFMSFNPHQRHKLLIQNTQFLTLKTNKSTLAELNTFIAACEDLIQSCNEKRQSIFYTDCQNLCDLLVKRRKHLVETNYTKPNGQPLTHKNTYKKINVNR